MCKVHMLIQVSSHLPILYSELAGWRVTGSKSALHVCCVSKIIIFSSEKPGFEGV